MNEFEKHLSKRVAAGKNLANAALDLQGELNEEAAAQLHWAIPAHSSSVREAVVSVAQKSGIDLKSVHSYIEQVADAGDPAAISLQGGKP